MIISNSYKKVKTVDKFRELADSNIKVLYVEVENGKFLESMHNKQRLFYLNMSSIKIICHMRTFNYYYKAKSEEIY